MFFISLDVWSVFVRKFYIFLCFFSFDLFWCKSLFWFSFELNLVFYFGSWLNQCFRVDLVELKPGQIFKALFGLPLFDERNFSLRACLTNTSLDLFWQFCFEQKYNFPKYNPKIIIFFSYCIWPNPYIKCIFIYI